MAASRSTTAKKLGPIPPVEGSSKPFRKLETAKIPSADVSNPVISQEDADRLARVLAQFARKMPEPPSDDLRIQRKAKEKAIKEKEVWSVTTVDLPSEPVVLVETPVKTKGKGISKKQKRKLKAKAKAKAPAKLTITPTTKQRLAELRVKHASRLVEYGHTPLDIPAPPSFGHVPVAEMVFKKDPPAQVDEGEVVVAEWAHQVTVQVPAGCALRTKKIVEFQPVLLTERLLAWYELHTPITRSDGSPMVTDLLYRTRKGNVLSPSVSRLVSEREPLTIGGAVVGVQLVTRQVQIPARFGGDGLSAVALRSEARSRRSESGRKTYGYPANPGGPIGLSIAQPAPVVKAAAANDDAPPWDDTPPPPATAVVGDVGFMEEVHRQRLSRESELRRQHCAVLEPYSYEPAATDGQWLDHVHNMDTMDNINARIRRVFDRSMAGEMISYRLPEEVETPSVPEAMAVVVPTAPFEFVGPKQEIVAPATRKNRMSRLLENIKWGSLTLDAKRKLASFALAVECPDREGVRIERNIMGTRKFAELTEATLRGWLTQYSQDCKRILEDRKESGRLRKWLYDAAQRDGRRFDASQLMNHGVHTQLDDAALQAYLKEAEDYNPSLKYWDTCDHCQAKAKRAAEARDAMNVIQFSDYLAKRRLEQRLEQEDAKGQAEKAPVVADKVEDSLAMDNYLKNLKPNERDVFLDTVCPGRAPHDTNPFRNLVRNVKDMDASMILNMCTTWVKGNRGILLPPHLT